jgi:hypothetical protein
MWFSGCLDSCAWEEQSRWADQSLRGGVVFTVSGVNVDSSFGRSGCGLRTARGQCDRVVSTMYGPVKGGVGGAHERLGGLAPGRDGFSQAERGRGSSGLCMDSCVNRGGDSVLRESPRCAGASLSLGVGRDGPNWICDGEGRERQRGCLLGKQMLLSRGWRRGKSGGGNRKTGEKIQCL